MKDSKGMKDSKDRKSFQDFPASMQRRILDFHFAPFTYAHKDRLSLLFPQGILPRLQQGAQGRLLLSERLYKSVQLEEAKTKEWALDWSCEHWRLALLTPKEWAKVSFHLGLLRNWRKLAKMVITQQRKKIEQDIGKQAYLYAVRKGPFLPQAPEETLRHGKKTPFRCMSMIGAENLLTLLHDAPASIYQRIILRLSPDFSPASFASQAQEAAWRKVALRLATEFAPQWARSCR